MTQNLRHVKGLKELNAGLEELPEKLRRNVLRSALRAAAVVLRDEVKLNAPVKSGKLRDGVKVRTGLRPGFAVASTYLSGKHAYLGPWMEYGVAAHKIMPKKGRVLAFAGVVIGTFVNHPGFGGKPFMRPALDSKAGAATVAAGNRLKQRLTKAGINTPDIDIEEA